MHGMLISVDDVVSQSSLTKMLRELIESHSLSSSSAGAAVVAAAGQEEVLLMVVVVDLLPFPVAAWFGTGRTSLPELVKTAVVELDDEGWTL